MWKHSTFLAGEDSGMTRPHVKVLAVLLALAGPSVNKAQQPPANKGAISVDHAAKMAKGLDLFKKHIRPLLEQTCLRCHGGKNIESELDINDRGGLIKGGLAGPGIVPGHSKDS